MIWRKNSRSEVSQGLKPLYPRIWRYCMALTGNRDKAGDLAQSVCLRALEKSERFEPGSRLDLWIFKITQRLWLNQIRADAVRQHGTMIDIVEVDIIDTKPNPESNLLTRDVLRKVMALPETQRATVMLVYVEGFSYREAAGVLNIPIGTVMSRLAAARAKLADEFGSDQGRKL
jgi:RNA polymerase sigma-70 factor, ECF subfamily